MLEMLDLTIENANWVEKENPKKKNYVKKEKNPTKREVGSGWNILVKLLKQQAYTQKYL